MVRAALHQVVTFADHVFHGNPAYVAVFNGQPRHPMMEEVCKVVGADVLAVIENPADARPRLSFFTDTGPHPGAGHATQAAAHVALNWNGRARTSVSFLLPDGAAREARRGDHGVAVEWPLMSYASTDQVEAISAAIGRRPLACFDSAFGYIAILADEHDVASLTPDLARITTFERTAMIVTAPAKGPDVVIRVFAPRVGLPEDPVCGTAHRIIIPYWAERLGKSVIHSRHLSPRGGDLWCQAHGNSVTIAGPTVTSFEATLFLPT